MHQEIHVHLGNLVHPVRETPGSTQAKAVEEMRWEEGHIPPNPRQAAVLRGKGKTERGEGRPKTTPAMAGRTLTLGPTRPGAPASPGIP